MYNNTMQTANVGSLVTILILHVVTGNAELGRFATHVNMKCGTQM